MPTSGNLASWLLDTAIAGGAGPRTALREGDRAWTYDELADKIVRMSTALRTLRLQRGERVLILMRDTLEAAVAILGTIHAGAVAVPVSELATPDDVQDYVLHAAAVIAVTDQNHEAVLDAVRNEPPDLREVVCVDARLPSSHDLNGIMAAVEQTLPAAPSGETDVALLLYSAGSGPGGRRAVTLPKPRLIAEGDPFAADLL